MGNLQNIGLVQFKNHREKKLVFNKRITGITGNNGTGKTNILDAIYYISASRSYFNKSDKVLQFFNQSGFRIDANFINGDDPFPVTCIFREDGKKELYIGKELIRKASDFIGHVQCVMIAPDDVSFINEGSEIRRKFMDTLFCLTSKTYLQNLQQYNKTLQQRNAFLKEWFETGERDATLMGIYNEQLSSNAHFLYGVRKEKMAAIIAMVLEQYLFLAGDSDQIRIAYESQLQYHDLKLLLEQNEQKDRHSQRTNYGIHKDDCILYMGEALLKNIASQGQKKTFLLALKLAEFNLLEKETNRTPILLLDDIFERLDDQRIAKLFEWILTKIDCQVFITDTHSDRLEKQLTKLTDDFEILSL